MACGSSGRLALPVVLVGGLCSCISVGGQGLLRENLTPRYISARDVTIALPDQRWNSVLIPTSRCWPRQVFTEDVSDFHIPSPAKIGSELELKLDSLVAVDF